MREFKIKTCLEVGDLLFYASILSELKNRYDRVVIYPDFGLLYGRPEAELVKYRQFVLELCERIFPKDFFVFDPNLDAQRLDPNQLCQIHGLRACIKKFNRELCFGQPVTDDPYVAVCTKVRAFPFDTYRNHLKEKFCHSLSVLSKKYKIVVVGERTVGMNQEYKYHGSGWIYSVYNDIISAVPQKSLIDITLPEIGITSPDIKTFSQDCLTLNKSVCSISIGGGGLTAMSLSVAKTITINSWMEWPDFTNQIIEEEKKNGNEIVGDVDRFIQLMESL